MYKKIIGIFIVCLFIGTSFLPIINAQFIKNEDSISNEKNICYQEEVKINDDNLITFTIQEFENGIIKEEFKKDILKNTADEIFDRLEKSDDTIQKIELLEDFGVISKTQVERIKEISVKLDKNTNTNGINNYKKILNYDEFDFTENSTNISISIKGITVLIGVRWPIYILNLWDILRNFTKNHLIIGLMLMGLLFIPTQIICLLIETISAYSIFLLPICPFLSTPDLFLLAFVFKDKDWMIKLKTDTYDLKNISWMDSEIGGFTGLLIKYPFNKVVFGYAKRIYAEVLF
ncbi:MAG: hypothetical protein MUO82_01940 [Candidatus Thermoplasmatota archaeon]|nr:hypothetical protein [Candidatus Thermoplasmatota archaeon]